MLPRLAAAADELAVAFAAPFGGASDVVAAGYLLGAGASASWARRLAGGAPTLPRLVDRARVRRSGALEDAGGADSIHDDHPSPSSAIVAVLRAASSGRGPVALTLGPKAAPHRHAIEKALGDLVDGAVEESAAAAPEAPPPACVVVAPYYWDRRDLDRLVRHLALEVVAPAPSASHPHVLLARGWDQRELVRERLDERLRALRGSGTADVAIEELDADGARATLRLARQRVLDLGARAIALYVHPLWREQPEVEREIADLATLEGVASVCVGHRSSLPWALGSGAFGERVRVDVGGGAPPVASVAAARSRAAFAARPTLVGLARHTVSSRM